MSIRFYDGRNNELTDEHARVDASLVTVTARGIGEASFLWSDDLAAWILYEATGIDTRDLMTEFFKWESWQDAAHAVLGVDYSAENPL